MDSHTYSAPYNNSYVVPAAPQPHNKKIQNYVFNMNEVLGKGNFSKVYRAVNEITSNDPLIADEVVAIKVVELQSIKTPALVQLLYSEIDILKTLQHPNVLNCMQVFTSANNCYIITELCDGGDVETRIRTKGPMEQRQARKLIYEVYQGLKYLAENNIVHRDIKIANIFLKNGVAKIADFGFARKTIQQWRDINIGSPIYMSPEGLIDNIYGPKTDVWAFGVFLYEVLHGDTPLGFCKTEAELKTHITTPLPIDRIKHSLPPDLKDLILKCLQIEEWKRISAMDIQTHPYMQFISIEFSKKQRYGSSILQNLEESKNRDFYGSQESTGLGSKLIQPSSIVQQSPAQPPGASPHRNYQKFLSIPGSNGREVGRSMSPSNYNQLNGFSTYNNLQMDPRKTLNGIQSNNEIKKGLSVDKNPPQSNTLNGWQAPSPPNFGAPIPVSNYNPAVQRTTAPEVSSKQVEQKQLSPMRRIPGKLILAPLSFQECVQLLHYCRLIYKSICIMNKSLRSLQMKLADTYSNWLLQMLDEINDKIEQYVRFEGERGTVRKVKLKEVINEYHSKYNKELKKKQLSTEVTLKSVQNITVKTIFYLDSQIAGDCDADKKREMIKLSHYLYLVTEVNRLLEKCMEWGSYAEIVKGCNIENFLNSKKETYDMNSYKQLKPKLFLLTE